MSALAIALLAATSFTLHLVWEKMHIVLYTGYDALKGTLPVYLHATLGDVLYTFLAITLIALFKGDALWFLNAKWHDYAGLAVLGFSIALFVEYKAFAFSRWQYTDSMPIVPFFNVGLSPVVQMTMLLPLSVFITSFVLNRYL